MNTDYLEEKRQGKLSEKNKYQTSKGHNRVLSKGVKERLH